MKRILFLFLWCVLTTAQAETVLVAVASNFTKPMTALAEVFTKTTGHEINLSFGSSGKFVAQIENGAPYEIFLSADESNPQKLEQLGLAVTNTRFTYAIGKLVLWSAKTGYVDKNGQILRNAGFRHLAIADPKLAPYGLAAEATLKNLGLLEHLGPLLVLGENISQTQQFIDSGNAELGFVALSQIINDHGQISSGSAWQIPDDLHPPIRQDAVLLKKGEWNPAAKALMAFLATREAQEIIQAYGYGIAE